MDGTNAAATVFDNKQLRELAFYADNRSMVFHGDAQDVLHRFASTGLQVDCIVTSPPFYGMRDYGAAGQIGHEAHPSRFISSLVSVFEACRPVLRDTGSLWVNIGDTYWSGKGASKGIDAKQSARRFGVRPQDLRGDGKWAKPKQLLLIPHRFAVAMQDAGWLVRNDNIWIKDNPIPDPVRDRCSVSHEHVFHFVKQRRYYFDRKAATTKTHDNRAIRVLDTWRAPTSKGGGDHKASFHEELVRLPVMATTPPGGTVLDPFSGSGTTLLFARKNGFFGVGIDLNGDYCAQSVVRLIKAV